MILDFLFWRERQLGYSIHFSLYHIHIFYNCSKVLSFIQVLVLRTAVFPLHGGNTVVTQYFNCILFSIVQETKIVLYGIEECSNRTRPIAVGASFLNRQATNYILFLLSFYLWLLRSFLVQIYLALVNKFVSSHYRFLNII